MGERGESVTVIVHGTFAEGESWWRPSTGSAPSTAADSLDELLRDRGIEGSVWRGIRDDPPVHIDLAELGAPPVSPIESAFGWSGKNLHADRVSAAAKLRRSLEALADRREVPRAAGQASEKLGVHLVAHSHGGNIVLEMMKSPPRDVELRSVTMLGTPLIWSFRAFRLFRVVFAILFVISLFFMMVPAGDESAGEAIVISVLFLLCFPWAYFWSTRLMVMAMRSLEAVWRHIVHGGRPAGHPAYGPRPHEIREQLGREILLLRSAEDEADLMMHFGASPIDAYRSLVRPARPEFAGGFRPSLGRLAVWATELVLIRPWVYILYVPLFEAAVERFGIGFPWSISMWRNQEMVSQRDRKKELYPADVVKRVDVTDQLLPALEREIRERASAAVYIGSPPDGSGASTEDGIRSEAEHLEALKATFTKLRLSLVEQFNLRHSMYYESPEILAMVADEIVAAETGVSSRHLGVERVVAGS